VLVLAVAFSCTRRCCQLGVCVHRSGHGNPARCSAFSSSSARTSHQNSDTGYRGSLQSKERTFEPNSHFWNVREVAKKLLDSSCVLPSVRLHGTTWLVVNGFSDVMLGCFYKNTYIMPSFVRIGQKLQALRMATNVRLWQLLLLLPRPAVYACCVIVVIRATVTIATTVTKVTIVRWLSRWRGNRQTCFVPRTFPILLYV
jgi:hypothetical protein